ncbi:rab protein geranylgeranyltransferase component A [Xylaria arbuscula]|nr:rab protein geranylgeranyltransferase component A [Xylaria arbuscula]
MESLSEETWDTVICGTGLLQSLLALALSRSNKRILHLDANDFYGENEAALSLQEADAWAQAHTSETGPAGAGEDTSVTTPALSETRSAIFRNAHVSRHPEADAKGLSFPRAYSLALAPQIIHTKSKLLSQLVSSKAYRQVEFLAVGPFFVYGEADAASGTRLVRIPSSREDVFSARSIPARSKRALMKFLKFVIDYDSEEQQPVWQQQADKSLSEFLVDDFKLDKNLRDSILAMTLTLDGKITVKDGLATIHRHLTSIGLFGPGFCAVYPKWGGISEIAQVGCRAGAVGGSTYMLNTPMTMGEPDDSDEITLKLSNDVSIRTTALITSQKIRSPASQTISRLVAVVNAPLQSLFETSAEGAPTPAVVVVAFPPECLQEASEPGSPGPIYAFVHSSDTGECPAGQSVIYLTVQKTPQSSHHLDLALTALLQATTDGTDVLYKLYYEQATSSRHPLTTPQGSATVFEFPSPSLSLAFDDGSLDAVQEAWKLVMKDEAAENAFMQFEDREGMGNDDDD